MQNKVKFRNILLIIVISTGFVAGAYFIYNTDTVNRDKTNIESVNKVEDIKVKDKKKDNKIDRDIEERNNKIEARESEEARENRVATIVDNIRGEYRGIRRQPLKYNPIELPSIPNIPSIPNTPAIPSVPVNPIIPTIPNPPVIPPDTDNPTDPGEDNGGDDSTPILVAGDKDPTFDTGLPPEFDDEVYALAVQSDGKIIVGGEFESYRGVEANYIIRLNTDGSRDTSFDIGTGFDDDVLTLAIQSDGKILVGGEFESYKGESANRIIRLNSNGSRDTSFDSIANLTASTYEEWSGEISQVAVYERALSEVEIQQNFNSYSYRYGLSEEQNEISTVNPGLITYLDAGNVLSYSGSGDSWYDLSGNNNNAKLYNGVTHNTNGGGSFNFDGSDDVGVIQLEQSKTLSNLTYNVWVKPDTELDGLRTILDLNGYDNFLMGIYDAELVSYTPSYSYDSGYILEPNTWYNLAITYSNENGVVFYVNGEEVYSDTDLDGDEFVFENIGIGAGFDLEIGFDYIVETLAIQSDGKIIVGGRFSSYNGVGANRILRLNTDGSIDTSFDIGTGFDFNDWVETLAIQSDGKIIVGGGFNSYQGVAANKIVRLNTDGSRDTSFDIGTGFDSDVITLAIQSDGKIIVGGRFGLYQGELEYNEEYDYTEMVDQGGASANHIIRLNSNGSRDTSFNIGTGFDYDVNTLSIQSDGKIIVGGYFNSYQGVGANNIIRLNSNGSIDTSFDIGTGFDDDVYTLAIQSDGKIIVGGDFESYKGVGANYIIRLNTDGSRNISFNINTGFNDDVKAIAIQSDGKIVVGGDFISYQVVAANRIVRLNTDGSIDTSFNIGAGFSNPCSWNPSVDCGTSVNTLAIQSDGKIIVGGYFNNYQGVVANRIVRLNTDGSIDTSFDLGTGFDDGVNTLAIQSDGKIIVGGWFSSYQGVAVNRIVRLNTDGSIDTSFNIGAGFSNPCSWNPSVDCGTSVNTLAIQSDGKIIVGGWFSSYQGVGANRIIRLNINGSRDYGFNIGTGFVSPCSWNPSVDCGTSVNTLAIQSDGKIIVGGQFSSYQGVAANNIIRLNTDGSIDTSFNIGTGFDDDVYTLAIQSDGKIIVGGSFGLYQGELEYNEESDYTEMVDQGGASANKIIRLNSNGSRDTSFNIGTGFSSAVITLAIQSDGKIIVGGDFSSYQGVGANYIVRLNTDGSRDTSFNIGTGFSSAIYTLAIQSDGKIIVGGDFSSYQGVPSANKIIRLNSDGSIDTSFNIGTGFSWSVRTLAIQSDGKIIVGGRFTSYQGVVANKIIRLNTDGSRDTSFNIGTGFDDGVETLAIQSDGKIIVGGEFESYKRVGANRIVRLNTDGSLDTSFNIGTGFNSTVRTLAIQSDGKIIVGGQFTSYQGVGANRIVRLNTDGSLDTSFNIGTGFNSTVRTLAIQSDGKIIVGGSFSSYQGVGANYIVRLNTDGSLDTSFNIGTGFSSTVNTLAIQSDGKIIVGGWFGSYQGVAANYIVRLNTDGSRDTSFNIGTGFSSTVNTLAIQSDGKIIVGGLFGSYQGVAANRIIRLNTDGSIDTSFNIGTGFNSDVNTLALQDDGKIIVGGWFSSYQGVAANYIVRLNTDGSRDTSFNIGTGFNSTVRTLAIQSDGKIIVGGWFSTYRDQIANFLIRINN